MTDFTVPDHLSGLFRKRHDRYLAHNSLSDMDVLLLLIYVLEDHQESTGVSKEDCRDIFEKVGRNRDNYGRRVPQARENNLIEEKDGKLTLLIDGLHKVEKLIEKEVEKAPVHIIRSGENFTAIRMFEEFLDTEITGNTLKLCDPHISAETLMPLTRLKDKLKEVKILTSNVHDSEKFESYLEKISKESLQVDVRKNYSIHDRYILSDGKCWSIGTSIKDLGNKDTIIREISEIDSELNDLFDIRWGEGKNL